MPPEIKAGAPCNSIQFPTAPFYLPCLLSTMQPTQAKTRRRAPRACRLCRSRKVRCVTVGNSQQCVNCQLDGTSCDLTRPCQPTPKSCRPLNSPSPRRRCPPGSIDSISGVNQPISSATHRSSDYYIPSAVSTIDESSTLRPANSSAHQQLPDEAISLAYPSYSFLQAPTIRSIFNQDRKFLIAQGCFTLPQRWILDEFIRHYFLHVHPMLPMLNEAEFWTAYDGERPHNDPTGKVPMIVMQAILFVCASVSPEGVQDHACCSFDYSLFRVVLSWRLGSRTLMTPKLSSTDAPRYVVDVSSDILYQWTNANGRESSCMTSIANHLRLPLHKLPSSFHTLISRRLIIRNRHAWVPCGSTLPSFRPGRPRQTSISRFPLLDASGMLAKSRRGIVSSAYGGAASFGTV